MRLSGAVSPHAPRGCSPGLPLCYAARHAERAALPPRDDPHHRHRVGTLQATHRRVGCTTSPRRRARRHLAAVGLDRRVATRRQPLGDGRLGRLGGDPRAAVRRGRATGRPARMVDAHGALAIGRLRSDPRAGRVLPDAPGADRRERPRPGVSPGGLDAAGGRGRRVPRRGCDALAPGRRAARPPADRRVPHGNARYRGGHPLERADVRGLHPPPRRHAGMDGRGAEVADRLPRDAARAEPLSVVHPEWRPGAQRRARR